MCKVISGKKKYESMDHGLNISTMYTNLNEILLWKTNKTAL